MPSDLAKKKAAKKKEAAKARQRSKKPDELNGEAEQLDAQSNGAESNGEDCIVCWVPLLTSTLKLTLTPELAILSNRVKSALKCV